MSRIAGHLRAGKPRVPGPATPPDNPADWRLVWGLVIGAVTLTVVGTLLLFANAPDPLGADGQPVPIIRSDRAVPDPAAVSAETVEEWWTARRKPIWPPALPELEMLDQFAGRHPGASRALNMDDTAAFKSWLDRWLVSATATIDGWKAELARCVQTLAEVKRTLFRELRVRRTDFYGSDDFRTTARMIGRALERYRAVYALLGKLTAIEDLVRKAADGMAPMDEVTPAQVKPALQFIDSWPTPDALTAYPSPPIDSVAEERGRPMLDDWLRELAAAAAAR